MEAQPGEGMREAVTVEAIGSGVSQQTVVTHRIWVGEKVHEDSRVFASLTEALVYASEICKDDDAEREQDLAGGLDLGDGLY